MCSWISCYVLSCYGNEICIDDLDKRRLDGLMESTRNIVLLPKSRADGNSMIIASIRLGPAVVCSLVVTARTSFIFGDLSAFLCCSCAVLCCLGHLSLLMGKFEM